MHGESKISLFRPAIFIKPDLTQEKRDIGSHLLREQLTLTHLGTDKKEQRPETGVYIY